MRLLTQFEKIIGISVVIGMEKKVVCSCESCQHKLCARKVPVFSGLDTEELSRVAELIKRKRYDKGEWIISEGSCPEELVFINSGQVKVFKYTAEGKEQILYIFSEGDFFGEKNLLKNQQAGFYVEALEPTNVCMINKGDFQGLLRAYPNIGIKIAEELCNRLDRLENALQGMGAKNVESRINTVLLDFAARYGKHHAGGVLVDLPLSREGIANYIGTTRETVSRKLGLLQDEGVVEMIGNKKVLIRDIKKLEEQGI